MFIVYKTTNLVDGCYYIGVHKTNNLEDSYLGSGKILKIAIKKYGRNNFKREILHIYDSLKSAYEKEKELVNDNFISLNETYNIVGGGSWSVCYKHSNPLKGESHPMWGKKRNEEAKRKTSETLRKTNIKPEIKLRRSEGGKKAALTRKLKGYVSPMRGKKLTDEDKKKKSIAALNKKKIECPHCKKIVDPGNGKLWHFEKCKLRF